MSDFEAMCQSTPFPRYGECVQDAITTTYPGWRTDTDGDLAQIYIAWLKAAGSRVEYGEMLEVDARLGAAELYTRMKNIANERAYNASLSQQNATDQMLLGLALINASQPQPTGQIICNSTTMGGGHVTTICH